MFTNIVGYSTLMERDERMALEIIQDSRQVQRKAVKRYNGELIRETGDQVIASFHSALKAVSCAVFIQRELNENLHLNLRIGIHIGDVILKGDDVFGDCVNIASKIENLTEANNICISEHVYNYIQNIPAIEVDLLAENQLNDLKSPVDVYKLSVDSYPEELLDVDLVSGDSTINRFLFWQELKRRKVIKVGSMYAAASFAILEAFDILFPAAVIPVWTITLIAVLVIAGFGISIYLAWLYDFTEEGFRKTEPIGTVTGQEKGRERSGFKKWLTPANIIIVVLMILIGILIYPKIFNTDKFKDIRNEDGRISIAVMPFKNLTGDTLYNIWQEGLQNLVISTLTNSKELSVRQFSTIYPTIEENQEQNYASLTPSFASDVVQKLNTKTFILGSILKTGSKIRITAQLMNAENEEIYKTFQMEGSSKDDIFAISDTISTYIKKYFDVKVIIDEIGYPELHETVSESSVEALRYYIAGMRSFVNLDFPTAINWLEKSVEIDSNFISAYFLLAMSNYNLEDFQSGVKWFKRAYQKADISTSPLEKLQLEWLRTLFFETPYEQIGYIEQILSFEDQSIFYLYLLGWKNIMVGQYQEAIEPLEKAVNISHNLNTDFYWVWNYVKLGECYHTIGDHEREREVYETGLSVLKENPWIIRQQIICALSQNDSQDAEELLNKYSSIRLIQERWPESDFFSDLGQIYLDANILDSALKYRRLALESDPSSLHKKYLLAWLLINKEVNLDEGMDLIDSVLRIDSEYYLFLDAKGWGLFKQGKYEEAYELIKTAWETRTYYEHKIFLHLEEVEHRLAIVKTSN
jgi:tetratricopeptide (TPR) repeat protein